MLCDGTVIAVMIIICGFKREKEKKMAKQIKLT